MERKFRSCFSGNLKNRRKKVKSPSETCSWEKLMKRIKLMRMMESKSTLKRVERMLLNDKN